jgi:hypothetical protein
MRRIALDTENIAIYITRHFETVKNYILNRTSKYKKIQKTWGLLKEATNQNQKTIY